MRLRSFSDEDASGRFAARGEDAADDAGTAAEALVETGLIRSEDLMQVRARQSQTGETAAEAAVALGMADPSVLASLVERRQNFHVLDAGDDRVDALVVAAFDPSDPLSQASRRLRGTISATSRPDGEPLRIVMLLAVDTRAEAALVAANLAVACAQTGYRTLLVDANLDLPVQHDLFRLSNHTGLSVLLSGGQAAEMIQPTAIGRLSLLTAGPAVRNFGELLDRARLYSVLRDLADGYDLVLVDASNDDPAIAVAAAEGVDGTLVVVRRDDSSLQRLKLLIAELDRRSAPVLGTILTN